MDPLSVYDRGHFIELVFPEASYIITARRWDPKNRASRNLQIWAFLGPTLLTLYRFFWAAIEAAKRYFTRVPTGPEVPTGIQGIKCTNI